jgi:hypothetical protein
MRLDYLPKIKQKNVLKSEAHQKYLILLTSKLELFSYLVVVFNE